MNNIQGMQEQIAVQTERIGRSLGVLQEFRSHLALPKFQGDGNEWISTRDLQAWIRRLQDALQAEDVVRLGSTVISFDHDGKCPSGVKGKVVGFKRREGCLRYEIKVESRFVGSTDYPERDEVVVNPPVNGVEHLFGGRCQGVELVS